MVWTLVLLSVAVILYALGVIGLLVANAVAIVRVTDFFLGRSPAWAPRWLRSLVDEDEIFEPLVLLFAVIILIFALAVAELASVPQSILDAAAIAILVGGVEFAVLLGLYGVVIVLAALIWFVAAAIGREGRGGQALVFALLVFASLFVIAVVSSSTLPVPPWLELAAGKVALYGFLALAGLAGLAVIVLVFLTVLQISIWIVEALTGRVIRRGDEVPWNDDESERPPNSGRARLASFFRSTANDAIKVFRVLSGGPDDDPVFRGTERRARQVATQRGQFVRGRLREYARSRPLRELLEIPPGLAGSVELNELSDPSADARLVDLLYQSSHEQALLFGRLVDALNCFLRLEPPAAVASSGAELLLRKLRWWERWPGEYPWVALVRTRSSTEFAEFIRPLRDWLGMGVRTATSSGWRRQRNCAYGNERGTVAGYLQTKNLDVKYAMTCAHVLPDRCGQTRITRANKSGSATEPDAALLLQHACVNPVNGGTPVNFVSEKMLWRLADENATVYRAGGYSSKVAGYIRSPISAYRLPGESFETFPTLCVQTKRLRYLWDRLPIPFSRKRFSDGGDSGSWVVARPSAAAPLAWLGMVVAGGEGDNKMDSYVLKAGALLLYFRRRLGDERPFVAHITEEI